jgi:hypothetical protein
MDILGIIFTGKTSELISMGNKNFNILQTTLSELSTVNEAVSVGRLNNFESR